MSIFDTLLIGHLLGDWLFQNHKMAIKKTSNIKWLVIHSLIYAFWIGLLAGFINIVFGILAFITAFITHMVLDNRRPVIWWVKYVKQDKEVPQWLLFVTDQCFHLIILALLTLFV